MSLGTEIVAKLVALGLGVSGTSLFIGLMPDTPNVCGTVYEYPGLEPVMGFGSPGIDFETPAIQVVFRGEPRDYATPRANAESAYRGLAAVEATTLSGTFYHTITPRQAPFLMRRDENERVYIACNFLCEKALSA